MFDQRLSASFASTVICATLLLASTAVGQTIWYVDAANCPGPGDGSAGNPFCEIQAAINAAAPSATPPDEIVVADGTYTGAGNKNLDFGGKIIKLRSASGDPAACIIDCQGDGRGFYFHNEETAGAAVQGFTIRNGNVGFSSPGGPNGGSVFCSNASKPTIQNCIISANYAPIGGGVACSGTSTQPTFTDCLINGNTASGGGGVYCWGTASLTLASCRITGNLASGSAGGGVGISSTGATILINCIISRNTSTNIGGGVDCYGPGSPILINCTISENQASSGGGLGCANSGNPTLTNCILWGDWPEEVYAYSATPVLAYSDIQGGYSGTSNINADPLFALADDYHILPGSPCVDAGTNNPTGGLPGQDGDGYPRALDGNGDGSAIADMGAYEFNPSSPCIAVGPAPITFYVPHGEAGQGPRILSVRNAGGGTLHWTLSWEDFWLQADTIQGESNGEVDSVTLTADAGGLAYGVYSTMLTVTDPAVINSPWSVEVTLCVTRTMNVPGEYPTIQAAIDAAAIPGDQVVLADGMFTGDGNRNLDFHGKTLTVRSASGNPEACVIDCQGSGRGFYFHSAEPADAQVKDLTIRNGYVDSGMPDGPRGGGVYCDGLSRPTFSHCTISANATASNGYGGGVHCSEARPTLADCTISGNSAYNGGGVFCMEAAPTLTNCEIILNSSSGAGGGVYCYYFASPTLSNCVISWNNSSGYGGAVYCSGHSSPTLTSCTLSGNSVSSYGAGIYCSDFSNPVLLNCRISKNRSSQYGGGTYCDTSSSPVLTNCTLNGNMASVSGGGLYCKGPASSPKVTNCILWGDAPEEVFVSSGTPVITFCDVQGGWSGTGNLSADPGLAFADDEHLMSGSPCVDAGTDTPIGGLPGRDFDGNLRRLDGNNDGQATADIGAYEFNGAAPTIAVSPARIVFYVPEGQAANEPKALSIRNAGSGILHWSLDWEGAWLLADGTQGESTGEVNAVTLTTAATGLPHGAYSTVLTVTDPLASNGLRTIEVLLYVTTTLSVPSDYVTIQAAIDAADPGDTVLLADGVYTGAGNRDLDFGGRPITVRSVSGKPWTCVIDCALRGRGLRFHRGETDEAVVEDITIRNGLAGTGSPGGAYGGGVYCTDYSRPKLINCAIGANQAVNGGGLYCGSSAQPTLANCTMAGNRAAYGGVAYCTRASPMLVNCSAAGNTASVSAGGVYCSYASPMLTNCVLWGDLPAEVYVSSGSPVVSYCDIQGGYAGIGNINLDPGFAFVDDLRLMAGSPCIDTGTDSPIGGSWVQDADGSPRPLDGNGDGQAAADMGAYETNPIAPSIALSPARIVFSAAEGQGAPEPRTLSIRNAGGGTLSWTLTGGAVWLQADLAQGESTGEADMVTLNADPGALSHGTYSATLAVAGPGAANSPRFVEVMLHVAGTLHVPGDAATIQAAIDAAVPGDTVLVANGTYSGAGNKNLDIRGKPITVRSAGDDPSNCTIDCEGSGRGFYFHSGESAETVIRGFAIRNGSVSAGSPGSAEGGGVYVISSSPTLTNCLIVSNTASAAGSYPYGGGVSCRYASPTVVNCMISGNTVGYGGGGLFCYNANPSIINCIISANTAYSGGGVYCGSASPRLTDCTVSKNSASYRGGAMYCEGTSSQPSIADSILWGDTPQEIYVYAGAAAVTYCDLQGGYAGTGNINLDPLFVDPDGPDNDPATWQDNDYRLAAGSPCIDAGQNSAVPADTFDLDGDGDTTEPIPFDLDGQPRFVDDPATVDCPYVPGTCGTAPIVDMGAYEYQPTAPLLGDLNCDGVVNVDDVVPFVLALVDPAGYQTAYPGCDLLRADMNGSGTADGADIQLFVDALLGG